MSKRYTSRPFTLRRLRMSRGVQTAMKDECNELIQLLKRHITGDWGDIDEAERATNVASLNDEGGRYRPRPVVSRYVTTKGTCIFIQTDWGRRAVNMRLATEA